MKLKDKKILIVEDEVLLAESIMALLGGQGAQARHCTNGKDAIPILSQWSPDVILSDYRMPYSTGLDLLGHVREKKLSCPVLWMSGHVDQTLYREAWRMGVYDVLEKPVRSEALIEALIAALEGNAPSKSLQGDFLTDALYEVLRIEIPKPLYEQLSALCASLGISMGKLALELLRDKATTQPQGHASQG